MKINSVKFIKGLVSDDEIMEDGIPQVAFVGRSNVGKSSLVNALTNSSVSRVSSTPGRTAQLNFFLINDSVYFVDLPGYGFAKGSGGDRDKISNLIESYLFNKVYIQKKIVLIIDINVGMTEKDVTMFENLKNEGKNLIIVLSKVDKTNQSVRHHKMTEIKETIGDYPLFPISSKKGTGIDALVAELLS